MEEIFPVGKNRLSEVMNSSGSDKKRLKLQEKANQNLENYPLFCKEKVSKQINVDSLKSFVLFNC